MHNYLRRRERHYPRELHYPRREWHDLGISGCSLVNDIWKGILIWVESEQLKLETAPDGGRWGAYFITHTSAQVTRELEMISSSNCVRYDGVLERAKHDLENRGVQPTNCKRYIKQLLELTVWKFEGFPVQCLFSKIFKTMLEEIPELIVMHRTIGLRCFKVEAHLSTTLNKILLLSYWTPFDTQNKHLRELLRNALLMLNDLGGIEEYHNDLREFMKRHTVLCAFMQDNADLIATEDSETTAEVCKNLRRLAQNLKNIASTKAVQYQHLYEDLIAHREALSNWLDSASPGQGRSLVDSFTDSLKSMASSMRREANFWNSQSNQFHKWPNIRQTYCSAMNAMPNFPSEQLNDHRSSTTPSIHGSLTQNAEPEPQRVPQAVQRVSTTFAHLQKLRVNTTQAFLVKSENSISKRIRETHGYLEFVVEVAEKQLSQPSEGSITKVIAQLAEKALCIAKRWNKLQRKVKYWGNILSIFSKPLACQTFDDTVSGVSRDDFLARVIATPDTLIHPNVIEFEICLRDMWHHFLSRSHFWARIDSDPASFTVSLS